MPDWIDAHSRQLAAGNPASIADLEFLSVVAKDKTVIGLGEASHGTQEFFLLKKPIVEYLVYKDNYGLLAIECPTKYLQPTDNFVQGEDIDIKQTLQNTSSRQMPALFRKPSGKPNSKLFSCHSTQKRTR